MTDLTQKMIDDYKPLLKEGSRDNFERYMLEEARRFGPIVNILKIYSVDGTRLLDKVYQRKYNLGTPHGWVMNNAQVGVKSLPE